MIVIVASGGTNIASVDFALQRLNCQAVLTDNIDQIKSADKVILPGVGAARHAMQLLQQKNLLHCIKSLTQPVLGVCLGMQLLFDKSVEGNTDCLGIIPGTIEKISAKIIPHMGWNTVKKLKEEDEILQNFKDQSYCYFVHSYYAPISDYTIAATDYAVSISAMVKKANFYGCQFHPEKSSSAGAVILKNFLEL